MQALADHTSKRSIFPRRAFAKELSDTLRKNITSPVDMSNTHQVGVKYSDAQTASLILIAAPDKCFDNSSVFALSLTDRHNTDTLISLFPQLSRSLKPETLCLQGMVHVQPAEMKEAISSQDAK
ncbi:hypothetical protein Q5P01_024251 [Channa striata]|uniref:Uncharacterized protein n=1 Tax=Channa striata TaxID=64152 RepID=A0AA88J3Y5_CHASR|nr:hypothetical protein Q5P01_024251 [Channa striata]